MRVLYVTGGSDRAETAMMVGVARQGVEVHAAVGPDFQRAAELDAAGVPMSVCMFSGRVDMRAIRRLRRLIRERVPDIVHTLTNRALSNALLATMGLPVRHVAYRGTPGHLSRWNPGAWLTYLNPRLDRIVCVCDAVRDSLIRMGVHPERLMRIYKGHDPAWYETGARADRKVFQAPDDAFLVGCVANMRRSKGADILLKALDFIPERENVCVLFIGAASDRKFRRLARTERWAKRIRMMGYREDAASLMAACDVFVMPSRREGLCKAIIEAMAQGIPGIVSDVGGLPEVVTDGETGWVVRPKNAADLAAAILDACRNRDKLRRFGDRARTRIRSDFTVERTVSETLALYRELVPASRGDGQLIG